MQLAEEGHDAARGRSGFMVCVALRAVVSVEVGVTTGAQRCAPQPSMGRPSGRSESMKNLWTLFLACIIAVAGLANLPSVSAHECESYDGKKCDPDGCKDGENHKHTHLRRWYEGDDESCTSSVTPNDPNGCSILGVDDWPEALCDILDENLRAPAAVEAP